VTCTRRFGTHCQCADGRDNVWSVNVAVVVSGVRDGALAQVARSASLQDVWSWQALDMTRCADAMCHMASP
jgi:hypothetical protein